MYDGYRDIYNKEQSYTPFSEMDETDVLKEGDGQQKKVSYNELCENMQANIWCILYENIIEVNVERLRKRANRENKTIEDLAEELVDKILNDDFRMTRAEWRKFPNC